MFKLNIHPALYDDRTIFPVQTEARYTIDAAGYTVSCATERGQLVWRIIITLSDGPGL